MNTLDNSLTIQEEQVILSMYVAHLLPDDFDEDFQKIAGEYKCPLCHGVYDDPVVDQDGNTFCFDCFQRYASAIIEKNQEEGSTGKIPQTLSATRIKFLKDILDKKMVKCKNRIHNCEWKGMLIELNNHMRNECKRQILPCYNEGCKENIFREEIDSHLLACDYRIINCDFCINSVAYVYMPKHHEVCPKFIMSCPQECGEKIMREEVNDHVAKTCLNTSINCPLASIGCIACFQKKDFEDHMKKMQKEHSMFMFCASIKKDESLLRFKSSIINRVRALEEAMDFMPLEIPLVEDANKMRDHSELFKLFGVENLLDWKIENEVNEKPQDFNDLSAMPAYSPSEQNANNLALQNINSIQNNEEDNISKRNNKSKNSSKRSSGNELGAFNLTLNPILDLKSEQNCEDEENTLLKKKRKLDTDTIDESQSHTSNNDEKIVSKAEETQVIMDLQN